MDDRSSELLQQILTVQKEQTELLRKHLGRFKFSIRSLLVLMTLVSVGLGYVAYRLPPKSPFLLPAPAAYYAAPSSPQPMSPYATPVYPMPAPVPAGAIPTQRYEVTPQNPTDGPLR